jgi:hypothetical protein
MSEYLIEVERAERMARDVKTEARRERVEKQEALAAVHAAEMGALRERFDAAERAKARPLPHLTASRTARMDKRLPRPVAQLARPEGPRPAAPPPDVERPARGEAGSELGVRFPFFSLTQLASLPFPLLVTRGRVGGANSSLFLTRCAIMSSLDSYQ